jgi:hypothetical protein
LLRAALLVPVALLLAACGGGRTIVEGSDVVDAGNTSSAQPDGDTKPPVSLPGNDAGAGCPKPDMVLELGSPCDWTGLCTVSFDPCMTGIGELTPCACVAGVVELSSGVGIGCVGHTGPAECPPGVVLGGACGGETTCLTDYCGSGETVTCSCTGGAWSCPGVTCMVTSPCAQGAPCEGTTGCSTEITPYCELDCECAAGALDCSMDCESFGPDGGIDAGRSPMDAAADTGPPLVAPCEDPCNPEQGPCTATDACGQLTTCECIDYMLSCSNGC